MTMLLKHLGGQSALKLIGKQMVTSDWCRHHCRSGARKRRIHSHGGHVTVGIVR